MFPNLKINVTAQLEFELVYFEAIVEFFSHYATVTITFKTTSLYEIYVNKKN